MPAAPPSPAKAEPGWAAGGGGDFANLDFLADASAVLLNLVPDQDGVLKLPRKDLGPHAMIHIVAVGPLHTTYRSISLPEQPAKFLDLRLKNGLDPAQHFTLYGHTYHFCGWEDFDKFASNPVAYGATLPFTAYDARTLKEVWSINLGTGINAPPATYSVNGKQYVAVLVGSKQDAVVINRSPELKNTSSASMVFVFGF